MRIVLVSPAPPVKGGISHYSALLHRHLARRHEVTWLGFRRLYPAWLFPGRNGHDDSRHVLSAGAEAEPVIDSLNPLTWLKASSRIIAARPDLVILPWWVAGYAPLFLSLILRVKSRTGAKVLFLCHNVVAHEPGLLSRKLSQWALGAGDHFLVQSAPEREALVRLTGKDSVVAVPHPTYGAFNSLRLSKAQARARLGLKDRRVILFFGFVRPYKGLDYLLQAMPGIQAETPARLVVAGEFWEDAERYRRRVRGLGLEDRVTLVDRYIPTEEVALYFRAADLVVLPYVSVTGSGLLQMAFGFHVPVVASRLGALAETVRHGATGFLVPPRDPQALARAVVEFFRGRHGRSMSERIRRENGRYSWEGLVEAIELLAAPEEAGRAGRPDASPSIRPGRTAGRGRPGTRCEPAGI